MHHFETCMSPKWSNIEMLKEYKKSPIVSKYRYMFTYSINDLKTPSLEALCLTGIRNRVIHHEFI
jgi:hypothetical protein